MATKPAHWHGRAGGATSHRVTADGAQVTRWTLIATDRTGITLRRTGFIVTRNAEVTHVRVFTAPTK